MKKKKNLSRGKSREKKVKKKFPRTKYNNIILIGFMCVGKSVAGKSLAKKLNFDYVSMDDILEKKAGMKISQIFDLYGEKYFRDLESEVVASLMKLRDTVIATGGGVILKPFNVVQLRNLGYVILLKANPKTIARRIVHLKDRPLLSIKDPKARLERIKEILSYRQPFYNITADWVVDTSRIPISQVVQKMLKKVVQK